MLSPHTDIKVHGHANSETDRFGWSWSHLLPPSRLPLYGDSAEERGIGLTLLDLVEGGA
jgi:hypothetical protein